MQFKKVISTLALLTMLTACGGGSDTKAPSPAPTVNQAPIAVQDSVSVMNGAAVTVDALSNDSDPNGDNLSVSEIIMQPSNGVVTLADNTIVYTPNTNYYGDDSFTYSITDGEFTSQAQINIVSRLMVRLSGIVTDSPLANANVVVTINGSEFETTTNAAGEYQIDIELNNVNGYAMIQATGSGQRSDVTLSSYLGAVSKLVENALEDGLIDESVSPNTRVTQLTTAEYLLAKNDNTEAVAENTSKFAALIERDNASELLEVAAFIKLIVDNPAYSLEADQTLSDFFASSQALSPRKLISNYLQNESFIDTDGNRLPSVQEDFDDALKDSAAQRLFPFEASSLVGKSIAYAGGDVQEGFLPSPVDLYVFDTENTGTYMQADDLLKSSEFPFTWRVENGKVMISFDTLSIEGTEIYPFYSPSFISRFGEDAVATAEELDANSSLRDIAIKTVPSDQVLTIFSAGDNELVLRERSEKDVLILNDGQQEFLFEDPVPVTEFVISKTIKRNIDFDASASAMTGDWILHYDYEYLPQISQEIDTVNNNYVNFNADRVTLTATGEAQGFFSGLAFTWRESTDGTFNYIIGDKEYIVDPFHAHENGFLAIFESYENGEKLRTFVRKMYKTEEINNFELSSLESDYPEAYVSMISAGGEGAIQDGLLTSSDVFSYQFNADDSVSALYPYFDTSDPLKEIQYFDLNFAGRAESEATGEVTIINERDIRYEERGWHIFKVTEDRIWFIRTRFFLSRQSQSSDFDRVFILIQPAVSSALKVDLSRYGDIWDRTLELGIVD